ncbi:hypothetical protein Ocin01_14637 [Orchesella cincta]|uniref:Uncharacterized protein n=1 Tax=Orchesella cincta TaxID=48709 RepID=A0A1D2MGB5_ORCCI|nr:hypothetical protein Ocin01_14637 [Orchesella cincta]
MDISIGKLITLLFWTILVSSQSDKNQSPLSSYEVLFSWKELTISFLHLKFGMIPSARENSPT